MPLKSILNWQEVRSFDISSVGVRTSLVWQGFQRGAVSENVCLFLFVKFLVFDCTDFQSLRSYEAEYCKCLCTSMS